jgi:tetratricopeptide (TPR) repeat protein
MKKVIVTLLLLFFGSQPIHGAEDISQREAVRKGIELIYNLDYAGAQKIFDQIKKDDPESPVGYGMTALNAFNQVLFASRNLAIYEYGIPAPIGRSVPSSLLDTPEQKRFEDANGALQEFCEKLLAQNPEDALALYFNGMSYDNLSILAMTHDRKIMRAKGYAKTAADLHKKALELDPGLIDAKASTAVLEYVVGSLNIFLRIGARFLGLKGDREGAIEKLLEVGEKGIYRSTDAKVALAYLQAWKGDPQVSVSILSGLRKKHPRSFLYDIGLATAYKDAAKDAKSAIGIYQELLDNISSKAPGVYPGEIHFRIAKCYVQLRDYRLALEQFQKALDAKRADAETEPLAYYNMARIYEERGEKKLARDCYQRVVDYSGPTVLIEDEIKRARKKVR